MKPNCDTVEYASTFLMSFWTKANAAPKSAVTAPTTAKKLIEEPGMVSPWKNTEYSRATM